MKVNQELISKYHLGQCTTEEKLAVETWLESDEAEFSFPDNFDTDAYQANGWEKLSLRYGLEQDNLIKFEAPKKKSIIKRFWLPVAACFAIVFMLGLIYHLSQSNQQPSALPNYQTINVRKGEKKYLRLSDGTEIWLNSESSISYPKVFAVNKRAIRFMGEAYFRVAKNPAKPFIISSPRSTTKVLGTRFNLRDYNDEQRSELVVEEGKVSFSSVKTSQNLILTANQKGIINTTDIPDLIRENIIYSAKYTGWKENRLVIDDLTLEEIKPVLERWYNIKLIIANKQLNRERYKGTFNNPGIKEVLSSICFAIKSDYSQQNKTFVIGK